MDASSTANDEEVERFLSAESTEDENEILLLAKKTSQNARNTNNSGPYSRVILRVVVVGLTLVIFCTTLLGLLTLMPQTVLGGSAMLGTNSTSFSNNDNNNQLLELPVGSGGAINFDLRPKEFVRQISECVRDNERCHIYYHHVGKTGGTTIEARMFTIFPFLRKRGNSCCKESVLKRFNEDKEYYCSSPFSSYQVLGNQFQNIVEWCMMQLRGGDDGQSGLTSSHRAIALTSFREPISLTLSSIHQKCNKAAGLRSEEVLRVCDRCSYDADPEFWDDHNNKMNNIYEQVRDVSHLSLKNVTVLTIDTVDISTFFQQLREALPDPLNDLWKVDSRIRNSEVLNRCNFGMKSTMTKALAPSEAIYRNLTLGL